MYWTSTFSSIAIEVSRTAEICEYCKASKVKLVWFLFFDIWTGSENPILIFKILFWPSHWVGKSYFDTQNRILTGFSDSVRMSKYDFECLNRIFRLSLNVKIGFLGFTSLLFSHIHTNSIHPTDSVSKCKTNMPQNNLIIVDFLIDLSPSRKTRIDNWT